MLNVLLSLLLTLALAVGLKARVEQKGEAEIIKQLQSDDWRTRGLAVARLKREGLKITDELKETLLGLLAKEAEEYNRIRRRFMEIGTPGGEGLGEYMRALLDLAVPLTDDQSAPHLVEFMDFGDDVIGRIVALGRPAFEPILEKLEDPASGFRERAIRVMGIWLITKEGDFLLSSEKDAIRGRLFDRAQQDASLEVRLSAIKALSDSGDVRAYDLFFSDVAARLNDTKPWVREKALQILASWLEGKALDGDRREAVKNKIIGMALYDPTPYVRITAVSFLAQTHDADVIPVLERIAKEDTATSWETGRTIYPVREAAAQALQQLRSK